jgi:NF-kappa-B inhibitor-like protein 1
VAREEAEARRRRRREDERAGGAYEGFGDPAVRVESANARAWREKLLRGAEADAADVLHEPMLFDEDAAETEGGFARSTSGSYARFFDSFLDDDDAAAGRDGLDGVRFEEEEDAYRAYASRKESSRTESSRKDAAENARARAARLRDLKAQRVLDEARRQDAAWRARVSAGADVGKVPLLGKRSESGAVTLSASAYRRAWGVVAAMADRGEAIAHDDLPWPTSDSGEAAEMREEAARTILGGTSEESVRETLSAKNARAALRAEMLRWHPDKFDAKMGGLIVEADRKRVRARVNVVARIVAALFQEARERT